MPRIYCTAGLVAALITVTGFAQNDNTDTTEDATWLAVITKTDTQMRCGANESYYPIATAQEGDLVKVYGKRQDWIKVGTEGSVFSNTVGYIKYPATDTETFVVNGETGTTSGEVEILGKNTTSNELYRSWRPICQLKEGGVVTILNTEITEPGTLHRESYVVHTVEMPVWSTAWVHSSAINKATTEQANNWETNPEAQTVGDMGDAINTNSIEITDTATEEGEVVLSLAELEVKWEQVALEPAMGAEVSPLLDMYNELLEKEKGDLVVEYIAARRVKQLNAWLGLQKQRKAINEAREKISGKSGDVAQYQGVMSGFKGYAVVGKLALSNTFDGRLRPFLYRVQDVSSGRTLGYIHDNPDWGLADLVGQTIGVKGASSWDSTWRVSVFDGSSLDLVSSTTATVIPDIQ